MLDYSKISGITLRSLDLGHPPTQMANEQTPTQVTLCRYESGNLVKGRAPLSETTEFFAISHVWGNCEWHHIPVLESDVLVSREKAEFITWQLQSIVGSHYFWMDVLCIDQRNREERIAVTQHIPAIFRFAQTTIVVKDDRGLRHKGVFQLRAV